MATIVRHYTHTVGSGGTRTSNVYIGNCTRLYLFIEDTQTFNAGSGNMTITGRGQFSGDSGSGSHIRVNGVSVATANSGIYDFSGMAGVPYVSVQFGTAVTGTDGNELVWIACYDNN